MVKTSFKQKIIQSFLFGFTYAMLMGFFEKASTGEISTAKFLFNGFFFGISMAFVLPFVTERFSKKQMDKIKIDINEDEKIDLESQANLNGGIGKIVLTNQRIIFKEKGTSQNNFVEIPLHQVVEIETKKSLGLINNIFIIKTPFKNYEFVVYENERNLWVSKISDVVDLKN